MSKKISPIQCKRVACKYNFLQPSKNSQECIGCGYPKKKRRKHATFMRRGKRILREQETKLYQMHIVLCLKTGKDALTPEEWWALSFQEKVVAAGKIEAKE